MTNQFIVIKPASNLTRFLRRRKIVKKSMPLDNNKSSLQKVRSTQSQHYVISSLGFLQAYQCILWEEGSQSEGGGRGALEGRKGGRGEGGVKGKESYKESIELSTDCLTYSHSLSHYGNFNGKNCQQIIKCQNITYAVMT